MSEGEFASLNCGYSSGDDVRRVEANRARALERLGMAPESLCTVRQVHGTKVVVAREPQPRRPTLEADALVADRPGITLGVLSADCAPVLLADADAGVIGAAHAGWRGALAGVIEATVEAMAERGAVPERIGRGGRAVHRPSLLRGRTGAADPVHRSRSGQRRAVRAGAGLRPAAVRPQGLCAAAPRAPPASSERTALPDDTHADEARFFSARRSRQRGADRFGLLLSAIALLE